VLTHGSLAKFWLFCSYTHTKVYTHTLLMTAIKLPLNANLLMYTQLH